MKRRINGDITANCFLSLSIGLLLNAAALAGPQSTSAAELPTGIHQIKSIDTAGRVCRIGSQQGCSAIALVFVPGDRAIDPPV